MNNLPDIIRGINEEKVEVIDSPECLSLSGLDSLTNIEGGKYVYFPGIHFIEYKSNPNDVLLLNTNKNQSPDFSLSSIISNFNKEDKKAHRLGTLIINRNMSMPVIFDSSLLLSMSIEKKCEVSYCPINGALFEVDRSFNPSSNFWLSSCEKLSHFREPYSESKSDDSVVVELTLND